MTRAAQPAPPTGRVSGHTPAGGAARRSSHAPTAGIARTPLASARGPLAAAAATPPLAASSRHSPMAAARPHLRGRSRVTTRGKTCSDTASGNDKPHTRKELQARQTAFSTLPLRYARFWVSRGRPGVISGLDTCRSVPIYSRHVVRAEWHGPSPWGRKSPIGFDQVLGLLVAVDCGPPLTYASSLGASLLPTTLGPPSKLQPSGRQPSCSHFLRSCSSPVSVVCLVLRPDTLRWCCSAPSWCMACRCLLAGTARAVVLPGLAQAFSRSVSDPCLAGVL